MSLTFGMSPGVAKEVRALLPTWLLSLAAVGVGAVTNYESARALGFMAYMTGCLVLGATAIGHEYSHGTLSQLLALPIARTRILAVKLGLLAGMLLTLGGVVLAGRLYPPVVSGVAMVALIGVWSLTVAPLLTMLTRNPLAGAVLSLSLAGLVGIAVDLLGPASLKWTSLVRTLLGLALIAAVVLWRTFTRLEAIDGRGAQLQLPFLARTRVREPRRRHAVWLLIKKELGLQQLTLVVVVIYVLLWVRLGTRFGPPHEDLLTVGTVLYSGLVALLIGSMASAEERQFGTLESQALLPMASWQQWTIKAATALGLAALLGLGLPRLLIPAPDRGIHLNEWYAATIVVMTAGSLYVSSLSPSGVRAFMASLSVLFTIGLISPFVGLLLWQLQWPRLALALIGGFVALLLWFGMLNHNSAERGAWRVWRQVFVMAGCLALAGALLAITAQIRASSAARTHRISERTVPVGSSAGDRSGYAVPLDALSFS